MSIPTILDRAQKAASQHATDVFGYTHPRIDLDTLKITMQPGLFRPRFRVTYLMPSPEQDFGNGPDQTFQRVRLHFIHATLLNSTISLRGSMDEWLIYQGWLSGRAFEQSRIRAIPVPRAFEGRQPPPYVFGLTGSGRGRPVSLKVVSADQLIQMRPLPKVGE